MKLPWRQWYPRDWLSDAELSACSPATRGIYKDWLDYMMINDVDRVAGSYAGLARLGRCSPKEAKCACNELSVTHAADVTQEGVCVTVVCRRLKREVKLRVKTRLRVQKHRRNGVGNGGVTEKYKECNGLESDTDTEVQYRGGVPPTPAREGSEELGVQSAELGDSGNRELGGGGAPSRLKPELQTLEARIPSVEEVVEMGLRCAPAACPRGYCVWWHGEMSSQKRWLSARGFLIDVAWELGKWWRQDQRKVLAGKHWSVGFMWEAEMIELGILKGWVGAENTKNGAAGGSYPDGAQGGRGKLPAWRELAILEEEISRHPGNKSSTYHVKDAPGDVLEDLKRKRARVKELKGLKD